MVPKYDIEGNNVLPLKGRRGLAYKIIHNFYKAH